MLHNVGKIDRIIRLSVGLILVVLYWLKIAGGEYNSYFIGGAVLISSLPCGNAAPCMPYSGSGLVV